jgi:transposase
MKNKYVRRSRISEAKIRPLVRHFALDLEATKIAILTRMNRNTVNRYIHLTECEFRFNYRYQDL